MSTKTTQLPSYEEIAAIAKTTFHQSFGTAPEWACCAPGRVNLIGEHVDYNDGFVLPMALPMVTLIVGGRRPGNEADIITCCAGADEPKRAKFSLKDFNGVGADDDVRAPEKPKWANYIKGVMRNFGHAIEEGFNAVIASNVPVGAGLSSSAALEVSTLTFLEQLTGKSVENDSKRALICQAAEHFAGCPCGIMDQTISVSGRKNHVLLLDCRSLETFQIPFVAGGAKDGQDEEKDVVVLICNSDVRHELSHSEYPTRRKQCSQALQLMALKSYRDATEGNLSVLQQGADREVLLRRARHVITEIKRTQEAAAALREHNFAKMGALMTASHTSLRDDFQVSCSELDVLVEAAINCPGVLGSRMTGGGFGGCTVTLLQRAAVDRAIATMRENFIRKFNKSAAERIEFYICTPSTGARRVHDF